MAIEKQKLELKEIDTEIEINQKYHDTWKPKNAQLWENGSLYITMNKELRNKIVQLVESIEVVMKKSNEVNKEKFLPEPENVKLQAKKE